MAIFMGFFASGCSHVSYLWQAGLGQFALYNRERPIEEVLEDPRTPEATREKLAWIAEIKKFAHEELGVEPTRNYTTYVDLKRPYVIWSITAAEPYELKLKEWSFPIVGKFPYLGFFKEETARSWLSDYESRGYDGFIRGVTAYSTLGYLRDPMLSSMLAGRRRQDLVNLILHETAHSEVYIKGEGSFNEQAASFIGDYGERAWLVKTFGATSPEVRAWGNEREDRRTFGRLLREFSDSLRVFYAGSAQAEAEFRAIGKKERFDQFRKKVETYPWKTGAEMTGAARRLTNNAALLAVLTYEDDQAVFDQLEKNCGGRLNDALRYLKRFASDWDQLKASALSDARSALVGSAGEASKTPVIRPQSVLHDRLVTEGTGSCLFQPRSG